MNNKKQVKHPCIGCVYFNACGEINRTMPCDGRMTRSERKAAEGVRKGVNDDKK